MADSGLPALFESESFSVHTNEPVQSAALVAPQPAAVAQARPTSAWTPELRPLTVGLLLTVTMVAFEALAVATVMPVVARELRGITLYGWVFSAFFLGSLVGIVVAGELVDRRGLAVPYAIGLSAFSLGLLVGGLAPAMPVLVAARAVQGFGAGAVPAVAYVVIGREYPEAVRPRMFAYLSTAWVVPGLAGPALAGIVADAFTWRAVFLGLLPLVAVAVLLMVRPLGRLEGTRSAGTGGPSRLWLAIRVAVGSAMLLAALASRDLVPAGALAVAGAVIAAPALRRLVPAGTLRARRGLPVTVLLRGALTFGFSGAEAYLPLMLVSIRGTSPSIAGLALTAATLSWTSGAWIQAHRIARWGPQVLIRSGFALVAASVVVIASVLVPAVPVPVAVVAWAIAGLGMGLSYSPITLTVLRLAPEGEEGAATAGLQLLDVLGTAFGAGAGGAAVAAAASAGLDPRIGLSAAFALAVAAALVGLALTARLAPAGESAGSA